MYLGSYSITLLHAFLNGWSFKDPDSIIDSEVYRDFQSWIGIKYEKTSYYSWSNIILFYSRDENHALIRFFEEFDDFLREKYPDLA